MSKQSQWLFETPSDQTSRYHANPEYETPLEQEWEMSGGNYYNFPLTEDEWEALPSKRRVNRTSRIPRRNSIQATPSQRHRVQSSQLRRPDLSHQGIGAETQILIRPIIDRFEFGSYLLKRHQFEQLHDLLLVLNDNKELLSKLQLTFRGHTDNVGGESVGNFHLAARRAMEVESFIKRRFLREVPNLATRIHTASSKEPIAPNTTKDRQARNRRVEVFSNIPLKPAQ